MAQEKDRKELLEEPDPVTVYLQRFTGFLVKYKNQLIIGGSVFLAVILIVIGVGYFLNRAENKAAVMLGKAMDQYQVAEANDGQFTEHEKLKAVFKAIIDKYPHTDAAAMAMVQYASVCSKSGDFKSAIDMYQAAYGKFSDNPRFSSMITSGLAYAYHGKGDTENAVINFEKVAADKDAVMKDQALFNLGLLYEKQGKTEKSRSAYEKIVSDYKDSPYYESAKMKLAG